jgi:hypothetical protein
LEDQGVDERIGSKWIFGRWAGGIWIGFSWIRIGSCKYGDEPAGSGATKLVIL